jgi:hypothetical protein
MNGRAFHHALVRVALSGDMETVKSPLLSVRGNSNSPERRRQTFKGSRPPRAGEHNWVWQVEARL